MIPEALLHLCIRGQQLRHDLAPIEVRDGRVCRRDPAARLRLTDYLQPRSADPTGLGALNSQDVPEPDLALVVFAVAFWGRRRRPFARCGLL